MVHRQVVRTLSILQGMEFFVITQTPDGKDIFESDEELHEFLNYTYTARRAELA